MRASHVLKPLAFSLAILLFASFMAGCAAPRKATVEQDQAAMEKQKAQEEQARAEAEAKAAAEEEARKAEEEQARLAAEEEAKKQEQARLERLRYKIWVGNYATHQEAVKARNQLRAKGFTDAFIKEQEGVFHVQIGSFRSQDAAKYVANEVRTLGYKTSVVEAEEK